MGGGDHISLALGVDYMIYRRYIGIEETPKDKKMSVRRKIQKEIINKKQRCKPRP